MKLYPSTHKSTSEKGYAPRALHSARELNQRLMAEIYVIKHTNREALEELRKYNEYAHLQTH